MPFKKPSVEDVLSACGIGKKDKTGAYYDLCPQLSKKSSTNWEFFVADCSLYSPINLPEPDDWLASHPEVGQTFLQFYHSPRNVLSKPRDTIYIRPCVFFPNLSIPQAILSDLVDYASVFFSTSVKLAPTARLKNIVVTRKNPYTGHDQVQAQKILSGLVKTLPEDAYCLAAVTLSDIYPSDSWNFVFGLASLSERCGIYSLSRFLPSFPQVPDVIDPAFDSVNLLRLAKNVMCHEIGHMFGMHHCIYFNCLMNGSNHREESEKRPSYLCPVCLRKLQAACKFNVVERYSQLQRFASDHKLTEEAAWYQIWLERHAC